MMPTQRTLEYFRKRGIRAGVVERYNAHARKRFDLLGFIDLVAVSDCIIGVQATTGDNAAARVRKIRDECADAARQWLRAGGRIQVFGWRKLKVKRGGKAVRWQPSITEIRLSDLYAGAVPAAAPTPATGGTKPVREAGEPV